MQNTELSIQRQSLVGLFFRIIVLLFADDRKINGIKVILCHHVYLSQKMILYPLLTHGYKECKGKQLQPSQVSALVCEMALIKLSGETFTVAESWV